MYGHHSICINFKGRHMEITIFENTCLDGQRSNKSRKQLPQILGKESTFWKKNKIIIGGGVWDAGDVLFFDLSGGGMSIYLLCVKSPTYISF